MNLRIPSLTLLATLLLADAASGVEPKKRVSQAAIHHQLGSVEFTSYDGRKRNIVLESTTELSMVQNESLRIIVVDPNPLLFSYKGTAIDPTESPDYKVAKEFAKAVGELLGALPKIEPLDRSKVGKVKEPCVTMPKSLKGPDERSCFVGAYQIAIARLVNWAETVPDLTATSATSDGAAKVKETVSAWSLLETAPVLRKGIDLATASAVQNLAPPDKGVDAGATISKDQTQVDAAYIDRVINWADRIEKLLKTVEDFAGLARAINEPVDLGTVSYDAIHITGREVVIAPIDAQAVAAKKSGRKTGTFRFLATAYSPVHFGIGPAAVYSFLEEPTYATKRGSDGNLKIVRTDTGGDVVGLQVAAMFTVEPRGWSDPTFGGYLQLGISTAAGKIGLLLGGSFRVFDLVSFGGGLAYQQRVELDEGLGENQTIQNDSDLKTHKRFRPGLFLAATVRLK